MPKRYSPEFKAEAVRLIQEENLTQAQVSRDLGVSEVAQVWRSVTSPTHPVFGAWCRRRAWSLCSKGFGQGGRGGQAAWSLRLAL